MRPTNFNSTEALANNIRIHAVDMTHRGKSSHVGSVLSICDILAVLYGEVLNLDPTNPKNPNRDRFILSKGHAGAGVYAVLAEVGFFDKKLLEQHYQNGSVFSGHVSHKGVPGVEFSTGSLGHGLGVAAGMALASHKSGGSHKIYVVLSDGECDEGSNWEAILFSSHHRLSNLIATVDYNKLQSLSSTSDTLGLEPFAEKWRAFGWHAIEVAGHDHAALKAAYSEAKISNKPSVLICHTTKGKGVSFMENNVLWHYRAPQGEEYVSAKAELELESTRIFGGG